MVKDHLSLRALYNLFLDARALHQPVNAYLKSDIIKHYSQIKTLDFSIPYAYYSIYVIL